MNEGQLLASAATIAVPWVLLVGVGGTSLPS
jgi:hypothetical protein